MNMDEFDWFIEDMMEKASVEIPGSSPFCLYFFANKYSPIMLNFKWGRLTMDMKLIKTPIKKGGI